MNTIKLAKKIIILPNADKGEWVEKYDEKEHGLAVLPHPARLCVTGPPSSGKTAVLLTLFLNTQASNRPYKSVFILSPHVTREWDAIDPSAIFTQMPDPYDLIDSENGKTLLIIDDYDFTKLGKDEMQRFSLLLRFCSSHHSISVYLSYQSFMDIPPLWRKLMTHFVVYKTVNIDELSIISKRVGLPSKNVLKALFKKYCTDRHDFLMIDSVRRDIRKNLFEIIPKEEYEDI